MAITESHKVTFPGHAGDPLAARLDLPIGSPRGYVLFAHCFTCSKDIFAAARVSTALARQGFAVLRFDFTGLGHSAGEFASTNFSSNVDDLLAAVDWLRTEHAAPDVLVGHSLGGAAVLAAAPKIPEAVAVATIGAPATPEHVSHLFGDALDQIESEGEVEVKLGGRPFTVRRQFLEDLRKQDLTEGLGEMKKALMIFHSPQDATVGVSEARKIYEAAMHPKSFVSLDGADHLLSRRSDANYVADVLSSWVDRYLPDRQSSDVGPEGEIEVAETGTGKYLQLIRTRNHSLFADEPADAGGEDAGLSPYDLLTAALGACTSMTLRMYAEHKNLPLEQVSVSLKHDKIHAEDCDHCETQEGRVDQIRRRITLTGDLSDEQRQRMLEIADRCPVHRTLHSEVSVVSELIDD